MIAMGLVVNIPAMNIAITAATVMNIIAISAHIIVDKILIVISIGCYCYDCCCCCYLARSKHNSA